jgi:hypothetical protein
MAGPAREEVTMGTHTGRISLVVAVLCLGLAAWGWAEAPAAEAEPSAGESIEIAQAPAEAEAAEAEGEVACDEMKELGICGHSRGIAYYYDDRRPEVWVTLGGNDGLRVKARVQFVRNDEVVAEGTVTLVRESDCVVSPDKDVVAGAIVLGDYVNVVQNGSRAATDAVIAREKRSHFMRTALIGGGLAFLIAL